MSRETPVLEYILSKIVGLQLSTQLKILQTPARTLTIKHCKTFRFKKSLFTEQLRMTASTLFSNKQMLITFSKHVFKI